MGLQACQGSILVVGGCGLLGRNVVNDLLDHWHVSASQIFVMDMKVVEKHKKLGITYHEGDIADASRVKAIFTLVQPVVVIHLASPPAWTADYDYYMRVNVTGTQNLINAFQETGTAKAFVYTSSSSVVHDAISDMDMVDESMPVLFMPQQIESYHHSKACAERIVLSANRQSGHEQLLTIALRPSGLFGDGDMMTIKPVVENAKSGKYKVQIGDGKNLFDWTYIENAARAHTLAASALLDAHDVASPIPEGRRVDGEAFFITNDEPVPFWDFVRDVGAAAGYPTSKDTITVIPKFIGLWMGSFFEWFTWIVSFGQRKAAFTWRGAKYSTQVRTFSIEKAKSRLRYQPFVSVAEGIRRSVKSLEKEDLKTK